MAPPKLGAGAQGGGKKGADGQAALANLLIQERKVVGVEDMTMLSKIENDAIVSNLQRRFEAKQIYTYIGPVLIACNPFEWLKIYETHFIRMYENGVRMDLEPHVFAVAESAFRSMIAEEEKQCVIISGESGAGKTEAAKQIMNYIAAISGSGGNDRAVQEVKNIVLDSNPALEAFGNAMTLRNNNSSRFGKYFELRFDLAGGGTPRGGYVTNYLLEKSRVVKPGPGERAFHIFYQVVRGAPGELQSSLGMRGRVEDFNMLRVSGVNEINNQGGRVDDKKEFSETVQSMTTIGILPEEQHDFFLVVALCLHLSNIDFRPSNQAGAEGSEVKDENAVNAVASLMEVDPGALAYALTYRTLTTMAAGGGLETYQVPMNPTQARAVRDALAKDLYSRLFDLLVRSVNKALESTGGNTRVSMRRDIRKVGEDDGLSIGVLDIYGFEIFDENHFEQFCINYVNEKLQQIFIELTLKSEQEDYMNEGIQWTPIPFFDNKVVCELVESKKPPGVFAILDDTMKTAHSMGAADDKFLEKLSSAQQGHPHFSKFKFGFTILHYAGSVSYHVDGFLEANKDLLGQDLQLLVQTSSNQFLQSLYPEKVDLDQRQAPTTAGFKIKSQCGELVYALLDCNPHYVRCVKSNDQKKAGLFDAQRVLHQARYLGLLENVKVRRAGFALRIEFDRFIQRFKVLAAGQLDNKVVTTGSDYDVAYMILDRAAYQVKELQAAGEAQLGKTKVFIKSPETFQALQDARKKMISDQVVKIQKLWRRFANRKEMVDLRIEIAELWNEQGKESTPADLLRPYHAFYIEDKDLNAAITNMLELYQLSEVKAEALQYTEGGAASVSGSATSTGLTKMNAAGRFEPVVFFVTDKAMYTAAWEAEAMEMPKPKKGEDPRKMVRPKPRYKLRLLRRTELRQVQGVALSKEADDLILIQITPQPKDPKPDKSCWMDKSKVKRCMDTQEPFSFFGKSKHQCAYTGGVYIKDVMVKIPLPDRGFYEPVEVHRTVPGSVSTEMQEDIILKTEKKAEIVALLRNAVTLAKGGKVDQLNKLDKDALRKQYEQGANVKPQCRALYEYHGAQEDELSFREGDVIELVDSGHADWWLGRLRGKQGVFPANYVEKMAAKAAAGAAKPKRANPKRYMLDVTFGNQWNVRPAMVKTLSNTFGGQIEFRRNEALRDMEVAAKGGRMIIQVPIGVAGRKLKAIQAAQAERRAQKAAERERIFELRRENAAQREALRQAERAKKLEAKKEKRKGEKDKRQHEEERMNFAAKNAAKGGASFNQRINQNGDRDNGSERSGGGSGLTVKAPWAQARGGGGSQPSAATSPVKQQPQQQPQQQQQQQASPTKTANRMSMNKAPIAKPKTPTGAAAAPKQITWEAYKDDDSGDIYWYNPASGESSWTKPVGANVKIVDKTKL